jgi:hypothetical protein
VNPWWGQHLFSHAVFWNFASWYSKREFGFTYGRVATRDSRVMLRRAKHLLISPRTADPSGWLLRGGSRGG